MSPSPTRLARLPSLTLRFQTPAAPRSPPLSQPRLVPRDPLPPSPGGYVVLLQVPSPASIWQRVHSTSSSRLLFFPFLFVSQRDHRIHLHRPPRGGIAGGQCHDGNENCHATKGRWVCRTNAVQFARQNPHQRNRARHSQGNPRQRQLRPFPHHGPQHISSLGSQRHANANFPRSIGHQKRKNAINPDNPQRQRQASEGGEQNRRRPWCRHRVRHDSVHGFHFADRHFLVQGGNAFAKYRRYFRVLRGGPNGYCHLCRYSPIFEGSRRTVRYIGSASDPVGRISLQIVRTHVWNDTNDGAPVLVVEQPDVLPYGATIRPEVTRRLGGHDRHRGPGQIGIREPSAREKGDPHDAKVFRSDYIEPEKRKGFSRGRHEALNIQRSLAYPSPERESVHERHSVNSR